jgi:hypothetical protein
MFNYFHFELMELFFGSDSSREIVSINQYSLISRDKLDGAVFEEEAAAFGF